MKEYALGYKLSRNPVSPTIRLYDLPVTDSYISFNEIIPTGDMIPFVILGLPIGRLYEEKDLGELHGLNEAIAFIEKSITYRKAAPGGFSVNSGLEYLNTIIVNEFFKNDSKIIGKYQSLIHNYIFTKEEKKPTEYILVYSIAAKSTDIEFYLLDKNVYLDVAQDLQNGYHHFYLSNTLVNSLSVYAAKHSKSELIKPIIPFAENLKGITLVNSNLDWVEVLYATHKAIMSTIEGNPPLFLPTKRLSLIYFMYNTLSKTTIQCSNRIKNKYLE